MKITVLDEQGVELKPTVLNEEAKVEPYVEDTLLPQQVGSMFNFTPIEISQFKDKINLLIEYAKTQTEDRSPEGLKWAIRSLQNRVGTPPLGEKLINYLSKYAWVKLESMKFDKEAEKYERGNY